MAAPLGNQFWRARAKHGRDLIFKDPETLWASCCEYFEWVEANPLFEDRLFAYQGEVVHEPAAKMRAMTLTGLSLFLGVSEQTWRDYRGRKDFIEVTTRAEQIIRTQKFQGAAADLLNANIIARDLGLADKSEVKAEAKTLTTDWSRVSSEALSEIRAASRVSSNAESDAW